MWTADENPNPYKTPPITKPQLQNLPPICRTFFHFTTHYHAIKPTLREANHFSEWIKISNG